LTPLRGSRTRPRALTWSFCQGLRRVFRGGHVFVPEPAAGAYDLRFLEQRLLITVANGWRPLIDIPYSDIDQVEVGGPGIEQVDPGPAGPV
jgi:hypothetical protein